MEELKQHLRKITWETAESVLKNEQLEWNLSWDKIAEVQAEQARNLSIEFAEWCSLNGFHNYPYNKSLWFTLKGKQDVTTEQLWDKFLEQKTF